MYISRIKIHNFRNFAELDVTTSGNAVIVGENRVGKTNFLYAMRLLLDPSLPDSSRQLQIADFWDGLEDGPGLDDKITISIEVKDFQEDLGICALLTDYRLNDDPDTVRLTYEFKPLPELTEAPRTREHFEFICYGGESVEKTFHHNLRRRIVIDVLPALRDAESDLSSWRKSPLRPLIEDAFQEVSAEELSDLGEAIDDAKSSLTSLEPVETLQESIGELFLSMSGPRQDVNPTLGLSPTDSARLYKNLKLLIDSGARGINDASLGSANLLYLTLKALELRRLISENQRCHTMLAIEEPEAHLHPHLQRSVYRKLFEKTESEEEENRESNLSIFLTTHSPHIASVAPLKSIILLRDTPSLGTKGFSTAEINLSADEEEDLSRYLDVTRAEILFSRGVILVEGDAERFLLPTFSGNIDISLDKFGITVCSVSGTNFTPYVKFLTALDIPFSVVTDWDPRGENRTPLGYNRAKNLIRNISRDQTGQVDPSLTNNLSESEMEQLANTYGIFLNDSTLEIELFDDGFNESIIDTLREKRWGERKTALIDSWEENPDDLNQSALLKMIDSIGKGRFAQRLAPKIEGVAPPQYIEDAIRFVHERV